MYFFLGIITGLLIAILIVVTLTYFRRVIEQKTTIIEKQIENLGPRPSGFLIEPESPAEEARRQIIARNSKEGKSTKLSELQ